MKRMVAHFVECEHGGDLANYSRLLTEAGAAQVVGNMESGQRAVFKFIVKDEPAFLDKFCAGDGGGFAWFEGVEFGGII